MRLLYLPLLFGCLVSACFGQEGKFVFVGVQGDETIDTVHESLESNTITWRVWWDGEDKRISTQWNIRGWPSTFVLDQRGVIRHRDLRGKELANAVRSLLLSGL